MFRYAFTFLISLTVINKDFIVIPVNLQHQWTGPRYRKTQPPPGVNYTLQALKKSIWRQSMVT